MSRSDDILAAIMKSQMALPPQLPSDPIVPPPESPPPEIDEGFFSNIKKGGRKGTQDLGRQAFILNELLGGKVPQPQPVESAPELGFNRASIGQFLGRTGVGSVPSLAAGLGGGAAGAAAGSVIPGSGTLVGGLAGAGASNAAVSAAQAFADAYNEARLAGKEHQDAIDYAGKAAKITGGIAGLSTLLGGVGVKDVFLKQLAKQVPIQVGSGQAENVARNALAQEEIDPNRKLSQGWAEAAVGPALFQTAQSLATRPILNKPANKAPKPPVEPTPKKTMAEARAPVAEEIIASKPSEAVLPTEKSIPATREELTRIEQKIFENAETPPIEKGIIQSAKDLAKKNISQAGLFDRFDPLKKLGQQATGALRESENKPYRMARFSDHMTGMLEAAFEHGTPVWDANEQVLTLAPQSKGLKQILAPVFKSPELFKDFQTYAYAKRVGAQELIGRGKEKNISLSDMRKALELENTHPEFKQAFDEYQKYNKSILDVMQNTGLINEKQRATWSDMDYIPFYREMPQTLDGGGPRKGGMATTLAGQKPNLHELTGGKKRYGVFDKDNNLVLRTFDKEKAQSRASQLGEGSSIETVGAPTKNIVENLFKNVGDIIPRAIRNAAAVENIKLGLDAGLIEPAQATSMRDRFGNLKGDIVSAYIDGEQKFFKVSDPQLYGALTSAVQGPAKMGPVMRGMNMAKNLFSRGVLLDPQVAVGIAAKDLILSKMMGKDPMPNMIQTVKNIGKGIGHEFGKPDPRAVEIMAMGGDTSFHRVNPEAMMKRVMADVQKADGQILGADYLKKPKEMLELVDKLTRGIELGNRFNKYDAAKKAGRTNPEAVFEAMDYMDYQMRGNGDLIPFLTNTVPFMASHLQGLHKLGREVAFNKGNNRTAKMIATMGSFAAANAFMNSLPDEDKEDAANGYQAQPDYLKNSSIMIDWHKYLGKKAAKEAGLPRWALIPKPWEIGFLSMTLPEHFVQGIMGDKKLKDEAGEIARILGGQLSMNPVGNPLIKTGLEQYFNEQFFMGNTIVPRNREGVEPRLQYGPKTTQAAKDIGDIANVSPSRIEHAVRGIFGMVGMYPFMAYELLKAENAPDKDKAERYIFNKFVKGDIAENPAFQNEMYDLWKASEEAYRTFNVYKKDGEQELMDKYAKQKAPELARRKDINKIKKQVKGFNDEILTLRKNKELSSSEKKEKINTIMRQRNLLLKEMHDKYQNATTKPIEE